ATIAGFAIDRQSLLKQRARRIVVTLKFGYKPQIVEGTRDTLSVPQLSLDLQALLIQGTRRNTVAQCLGQRSCSVQRTRVRSGAYLCSRMRQQGMEMFSPLTQMSSHFPECLQRPSQTQPLLPSCRVLLAEGQGHPQVVMLRLQQGVPVRL